MILIRGPPGAWPRRVVLGGEGVRGAQQIVLDLGVVRVELERHLIVMHRIGIPASEGFDIKTLDFPMVSPKIKRTQHHTRTHARARSLMYRCMQ